MTPLPLGQGHATGSRLQPTICRIELPPTQLFATPSTDAFSHDEIDLPLSALFCIIKRPWLNPATPLSNAINLWITLLLRVLPGGTLN